MNRLLPLLIAAAAGAVYFFTRKAAPVAVPAKAGEQFKVIKESDKSMRPEKEVGEHIKRAFVELIAKYAAEIKSKYGIAPVITIAQAARESNYGTSGLAQQGRNLYGIKISKAWEAAGKPVWTGQTEENVGGKYLLIKDKFKKYASWRDSVYDWAELISKVYKSAYVHAKTGDAAAFARALHATGYSTHPDYEALITASAEYVKTRIA